MVNLKKLLSFNKNQFFKALSLLGLSLFLSLVPLIYGFFDYKYSDNEEFVGFVNWAITNSEIYFLLLSTVFTSFIEYIITVKKSANGLIFINIIYMILISSVWAMAALRLDLVENLRQDYDLRILMIVLILCAFLFCFVNLLFMNIKQNTNCVQIERRKKVF